MAFLCLCGKEFVDDQSAGRCLLSHLQCVSAETWKCHRRPGMACVRLPKRTFRLVCWCGKYLSDRMDNIGSLARHVQKDVPKHVSVFVAPYLESGGPPEEFWSWATSDDLHFSCATASVYS